MNSQTRKQTARRQLIALLCTGFLIYTQWIGLIFQPKWIHCGTWSRTYWFGISMLIALGALATFIYGWWVLVFSDTPLEERKEKPYRLVANLAWAGMVAFMAAGFVI